MILEVSGLNIVTADTGSPIVRDLSCSLGQGQTLGIVGESGSGKTSTALAMLGMVRPGLAVASGRIEVAGEPMLGRRERDLRLIRGRVIAYLGQDPASLLTPTMRVGRQVAETLALGPGAAPDRVSRWLESFELPGHREFQRRYPHQISGGEQQRVALARALASHPRVLVLDEPTTGLDVVTQDLVLTEIERQRSHLSLTVVIVSHDLAVVARLADRVLTMSGGEVVEQGNLVDVLSTLQHGHTRSSLAEAAPDHRAVPARQQQQEPKASLRVEHLTVSHRSGRARVVAADDVSFNVEAGHCLALVGSSGSGKTTIARSVVGLHRPDGGGVYLHDVLLAGDVKDRSRQQRRRIQLVHQDPYGSLNPRHRVGKAIARPLQLLHGMTTAEARAEVRQLLERVRLPASFGDRLPARLSGGERQRVAIAMALAAGPGVLVCDEITSALDTSVQATILDLIDELRRDLGLGVLLISHDLGVVARLADRVLVLDHGRVCEQGPVEQVLTSPDHDVTKKLLASSPSLSATLRGLG